MRRLLVLISVAFLAGCSTGASSTGSPTGLASAVPGSAGPTSASVAPSAGPVGPASSPGTLSFSGSTNQKTRLFTEDGALQISYKITSHASFVIDLDQPDGTNVASVANLVGSAKITTWDYGSAGAVYLDVIAHGPWTITVNQLAQPSALAVPVKFSGVTEVTTPTVTFLGGETITWTYKGAGSFILDLISASDGTTVQNLVTTTGPGEDNTVPYTTGALALRVTATGSWTVSITQ
ncbi:MAG TPA: hypothetical protein VKR24_00985 [Candidatus Limnocylindrales bacterium]|nr:hypothetical protein [Candidatus Limnocylindrales bacterium]